METGKLIETLKSELRRTIMDECQVVYIMLLIRKIHENNTIFHTLIFYCNWSLHTQLSCPRTVRYIETKFDNWIDDSKGALEAARSLKNNQKSFFKLNDLKIELKQFFQTNGLPTFLCDDNKQWNQFSRLFLNIIECSPIKCANYSVEVEKQNESNYCFRITQKGKHVLKIKLKYK
ncbi:MAG: hypothetical protein PHI23_00700 [Candidatus Peribacteraceae bacterium]|nr:hypothetical protein [Candidatus Peribacteraceae bacterium]